MSKITTHDQDAQQQHLDPSMLLAILGERPIVFHRLYMDVTGSVSAALWLAYAIYHIDEQGTDEQGWWSKSQADWELDTGLSRREQESARKRLSLLGVVEEQRQQNAPLLFRLNMPRLYELMRHHAFELNQKRAQSNIGTLGTGAGFVNTETGTGYR